MHLFILVFMDTYKQLKENKFNILHVEQDFKDLSTRNIF
jgi:hypothetical protein